MGLRNNIKSADHIDDRFLATLTDFYEQIIAGNFWRIKGVYERLEATARFATPDLELVRRTLDVLHEAPPKLLDFSRTQARALDQLMEWGADLRKVDDSTFLGKLTPADAIREDWRELLKAGYFD